MQMPGSDEMGIAGWSNTEVISALKTVGGAVMQSLFGSGTRGGNASSGLEVHVYHHHDGKVECSHTFESDASAPAQSVGSGSRPSRR